MYSHKGIQCIKNAFVIIINANWKVVGSNSLRVLQEFFKWTTGPVHSFIDPHHNFIFCFESTPQKLMKVSSPVTTSVCRLGFFRGSV